MHKKIGVDIGGTFTDLIYLDEENSKVTIAKVPSTPSSPEEGCVNAVLQALSKTELSHTNHFLHGTTVGLNALLQRSGAVVGLLCTKGFRDVIEIRRGDRLEMFNPFWSPPEPLVPRYLRLAVNERISSKGEVDTPFDAKDVEKAYSVFKEEGVTSIAVAFINSYVNPSHELEAEATLRKLGFDGHISLSHRISGEYREYERTTTTVVDAFVRRNMSDYLSRLSNRLKEEGFKGTGLITRSGGGSMTFPEAEVRPFETIMSGPVSGVEGAAALSRSLGISGGIVTADVGGTSFDTALVLDGKPTLLYEGEIIGLPLQTSWVDVRSIGAGGGSIAYVDAGGLLRVGPKSAGAVPGPACYGRGGEEPTVTDAAAILGMFGGSKFESGLVLDMEQAETAINKVASQLGQTVKESARGIMAVIAASMANAIREITVEQGIDPRELTLMPFGGAGPIIGTILADELTMNRIIVPPHAGNFSAWGLLQADLVREEAKTQIIQLSGDAIHAVNDIAASLFDALKERVDLNDENSATDELTVKLDMRYVGQEHTITIDANFTDGRIVDSKDDLRNRFIDDYRRTFGIAMDEPVEIVAIRASIRSPLPRSEGTITEERQNNAEIPKKMVTAWSFRLNEEIPFKRINRADLKPGFSEVGPLIVNEVTTTTYVDHGFEIKVDDSNCLFIERSV